MNYNHSGETLCKLYDAVLRYHILKSENKTHKASGNTETKEIADQIARLFDLLAEKQITPGDIETLID